MGGRHRGDRDGPCAKSKLTFVPVIAIVCLNTVIAIVCLNAVIVTVIAVVLTGAGVAVTAGGSARDSSNRSLPDVRSPNDRRVCGGNVPVGPISYRTV